MARDTRMRLTGTPFEHTEHEYTHAITEPDSCRNRFGLRDVPKHLMIQHPDRPLFRAKGSEGVRPKRAEETA